MPTEQTGISIFGTFSASDVAEVLRQFKEDAAALDADMHELVMQHPHRWAGMYRGEVTIADTLPKLMELLENQQNVAVRYLDPNPALLILSNFGLGTVH